MMTPQMTSLLSILLLSTIPLAFALDPRVHFQQWYPQFGYYFADSIQGPCHTQYSAYINPNNKCPTTQVSLDCLTNPIVDCLLNESNEDHKANLAAASVLLGLLPTILSLAGSSTTELGLLALRRPILAVLLSAASPVVNPIRAFEYRSPVEMLRVSGDSLELPDLPSWARAMVSGLQYALAGAAVSNVAVVIWQLSIRTVCAIGSASTYFELIWLFMAVAIHISGAVALFLRTRLRAERGGNIKRGKPVQWRLSDEMQLSAFQRNGELTLKKETLSFVCLAWFTSTLTVVHIFYGTMVFASILFIGTTDASIVAGRLLASTLLARIILMYELSGMRKTVRVVD